MKKSEDNVTAEIIKEIKKTKLTYAVQTEKLNSAISKSLKSNKSKQGGDGGCIPDLVFTFKHENETWFGFIENKNGKDNMEKLDDDGFIKNHNNDGKLAYKNVISKYALNGAYYYARNSYNDTDYKNYLIIGVCGYEDGFKKYKHIVNTYILTPETGGVAAKFKDFSNLSFLYPENLKATMKEIALVHLTDEQKEKIKEQSEKSIDGALTTLNQQMRDELGIDAKWRINIVVAMILAGIGDKNYNITPLKIEDLKGSEEADSTDADIILRKINALLKHRKLPTDKADQIKDEIKRTIKYNQEFNQVRDSGETVLKTTYREIKTNILPFAENKMLDFSGAVYNRVTDWMGLADDEKNDVVLTPRYVVDLMVGLTRVDMNSYVWDFALGSGGFLISAMNVAIKDAKDKIKDPDEYKRKERSIGLTPKD